VAGVCSTCISNASTAPRIVPIHVVQQSKRRKPNIPPPPVHSRPDYCSALRSLAESLFFQYQSYILFCVTRSYILPNNVVLYERHSSNLKSLKFARTRMVSILQVPHASCNNESSFVELVVLAGATQATSQVSRGTGATAHYHLGSTRAPTQLSRLKDL